MNALPPAALERIAHNLCSLHDFDPAFVAANEAFALAVIAEYSAACPPPVWREISAIQADDIGREGVVVCTAASTCPGGSPRARPAGMATSKNDKKAFTLPQLVRATSASTASPMMSKVMAQGSPASPSGTRHQPTLPLPHRHYPRASTSATRLGRYRRSWCSNVSKM